SERPLLSERAARDRPELDLDLRGRAGRIRYALRGDLDVAHVGGERRLDGLVAKQQGRLLERERVDDEPGARIGLPGLWTASGRRGRTARGATGGLLRVAVARRQVFEVQGPVALAAHVDVQAGDEDV